MAEIIKTATRDAYGKALVELGGINDKVIVLDADLAAATKTGVRELVQYAGSCLKDIPIPEFEIETPDVIVKVNPERSDLVETREIDGRRCLVIAIDNHLEVNGIEVK